MAKGKNAAAIAPPMGTDADARQRELIKSAAQKRQRGERLSQAEERAVKRFEQQQRERHGQEYCRQLPKAHYLQATGVANKVILEQAQKLDLPWNPHEKSVDLFAMVAAFHRLISENPKAFYRIVRFAQLKEVLESDENVADWGEEFLKEKTFEARDKREVRRGEMLHAAAVAQVHARLADRWKRFAETLGQRFGEAAQRLFAQAWDDQQADLSALIDEWVGDGRSE